MRIRIRPFALAGLAALGACQLDLAPEPQNPTVHFALSPRTTEVDEEGEPLVALATQEHIAGSLAMLFGSPANPRFLRTAQWVDDGLDPNWPTYAVGDDGSGEFDEDELAALHADNRRDFARELAAVEAGEFERVRIPSWLPDLAADWRAHLASKPADQRDEEFKTEAARLLVEFYPTLRDSAELYRQQCLHCHGTEGGGDGPTSRFLNPRPRDYRRGIFKFTAQKDKSVPTRADLYTILDEGVTGTAMPSFRRFSKAELHGLVDYVRLLSIRGMVEHDLVTTVTNDDVLSAETVLESYASVWEKWNKAPEKWTEVASQVPAPTKESLERGRTLFMDAGTGNCFSCHGAEGRGDGSSAFTTVPETGEIIPAYKDDWGNEILPRNLRQGVFRGGRRPIDIYYRIKNGINGTPMPAAVSNMTDEDIWALVHYVGALSEQPRTRAKRAAAHAGSQHGDSQAGGGSDH
jgi:mono/diheme cytochrome c family protein